MEFGKETFSLPAGSFEYIYCTDGWAQQETAGLITAMQNGGTCAPVTDYFSYANRLITVGAMTTVDTWGSCSACVAGTPGCTDPLATNYDPSATVDDGSCIYGPVLTQIDLPISWDDTTVDYTVTDFGGTASSLSQDPLNSSNTVLMTDRTAGSQTWAGTTLSTSSGLLSAIPFVSGATTISAHVYSPASGVVVRLKAEDHTNAGISVETEATTTISNGWNTLVFDFANEANGTAAINFSNTYDMLSIFFDFGNSPSASTIYYLDSVYFGGVAPVANTVDLTLSVNTANITVGPNGMYAGGGVLGDAMAVPLSDPTGSGTWTGVVTLTTGTSGNYIFLNSPAHGGDWGN